MTPSCVPSWDIKIGYPTAGRYLPGKVWEMLSVRLMLSRGKKSLKSTLKSSPGSGEGILAGCFGGGDGIEIFEKGGVQ